MNIKHLLFALVIVVPLANAELSFAQVAACIDSDGDGFGWNGITSCRVPVATDSRNELLMIDINTESRPDGSVAITYCPQTQPAFPNRP